MVTQKNFRLSAEFCADRLSFLCLWITGGMLFLLMIFGYVFSIDLLFSKVICIPLLAFAFVIIRTKALRSGGYIIPLAAAMMIWFLLAEGYHRSHQMNPAPVGIFLSVYLIAFPFAAVSRDQVKQKGLQIIAAVYIVATLFLSLYALMLIADCVPAFLRIFVIWDGLRLSAIWHPNILACLFMISIAFCMGFCLQLRKWQHRCLCICAAVFLFAVMSLTNCRTAILMTCLLVSGEIFFAVIQGNYRRFFAAFAAALVVFTTLALASSGIFRLHSHYQSTKAGLQYISPEEIPEEPFRMQSQPETEYVFIQLSASVSESAEADDIPDPTKNVSTQKSFLDDLKDLNKRTVIWKEAIRAVSKNPLLLLWGTDNPGAQIKMFPVEHCHNSWLEILLLLGLPGLLMSLLFTGLAVWKSCSVLLRRDTDLWKKTIALLVLCILISSIMEPYLFTATIHYYAINFIFFLCLGYLTEWTRCKSA